VQRGAPLRLRALLAEGSGWPAQPYLSRCNAMWRNARRRNATFHSARATNRKIHFIRRGETSSLGVARVSRSWRGCVCISRVAPRAGIFLLPFSILLPLRSSLSLSLSLSLSFSFSLSLLVSPLAKIALFLYNARIRWSYCNLVRSRFRVIGEEKYFHGCGAPREKERERERALPLHAPSVSFPSPVGRVLAEVFRPRSENHARP